MTLERDGKPPAQMAKKRRATIKDVARHAGVSFKTVSRVLNEEKSVNAEMREAVQASVAALDYRPHRAARSLRTKRSYAMALIASGLFSGPRSGDRPDWAGEFPDYLSDVIIGCTGACRNLGNHLVLEFVADSDIEESAKRARALLDDANPDGVLVSPPICDAKWLLDIFDLRSIPYVRLMPGTMLERGAIFAIDDHAAAREMTEYLLSKGHRHIAYIGGPQGHRAAQARASGFAEAMSAVPDAKASIGGGQFNLESGEQAARALLTESDRPTAIFAANDAMAVGAMKAAKKLGLSIPEDVSITGFDDSAAARMAIPALTTMGQPTRDLAFKAIELLASAVDDGVSMKNGVHLSPHRLVERESVSALTAK